MDEVDVLVVGAGPAGATAALNLAPTHRVLMVDCKDFRRQASVVGESLAPAAGRLLKDMGLFESFVAERHLPWHGNRSVWGGAEPAQSDFMRDLDGHGWHLDRPRFDAWLRAIAVERGAGLCTARLDSAEWDNGGWNVLLSSASIRARILIDATGKHASVAHRLGATHVRIENRLVCAWMHGTAAHETAGTAGFTMIEAVEDGWWYTSPVPHGRRVLAFHTDPDLPGARTLRTGESMRSHAGHAPELSEVLRECQFSADESEVQMTLAGGGTIIPSAAPGWFAAGDAAVHFDPLSSQGLLNALFTGLASAEAADRLINGRTVNDYGKGIDGIWDAYQSHLRLFYLQENRWPQSPFWNRRHTKAASPMRASK